MFRENRSPSGRRVPCGSSGPAANPSSSRGTRTARASRCASAFPSASKLGSYEVSFHNGYGGPAGWRPAAPFTIAAPLVWPAEKFSVLDHYGKDAEAKSRESLGKFRPVPDRTEGIRAALDKARKNGGGIVYFPAGKYGVRGELSIPPRTVLKGEGTGTVVLWWGDGRFNIDGGDQKGLARRPVAPKTPANLITGREFGSRT